MGGPPAGRRSGGRVVERHRLDQRLPTPSDVALFAHLGRGVVAHQLGPPDAGFLALVLLERAAPVRRPDGAEERWRSESGGRRADRRDGSAIFVAHGLRGRGRSERCRAADRARQGCWPHLAARARPLALTCDFRIAADNAKFVQAFVNIGLVPDAGGIYLLNQLVGAAKTTELVMLGDKLSANDMARLNLVNEVVSAEDLDASVLALATRLSQLPAKALASMKHMINTHAFMGLNEALDMEVNQQTMMAQTEDFKEGITAFMEKRKPVYQSK